MSTPIDDGQDLDLGHEIASLSSLMAYFDGAGKARDDFRIGTEHEKFGFTCENREPLVYEGARGIGALLEKIACDSEDVERYGQWTRIEERGSLIGLSRAGASISLEPGGQLELSGAPLKTIHQTASEVGQHLHLLRKHAMPNGIGFLGIGFHPSATRDEIRLMPKSRYDIMYDYMPKVGTRGRDMMTRTSTIQANFDFEDEMDMRESMQCAMKISPIVAALFANSPFVEGKPSGWQSERLRVWLDTDSRRSGFQQSFLESDFGYETYLNWLLDVPMYFIRRKGKFINVAGASFKDFVLNGLGEHRAHWRDFEDHMTVAFPEVRLKRYLEVRSADAGPWSHICALPALWKGILYDPISREKASALLGVVSAEELFSLQEAVARDALKADFRGVKVLSFAEKLLELSIEGLARQRLQAGGDDESIFLEDLIRNVEEGLGFSERLLAQYHQEWEEDLDPLWYKLEFYPTTNQGVLAKVH